MELSSGRRHIHGAKPYIDHIIKVAIIGINNKTNKNEVKPHKAANTGSEAVRNKRTTSTNHNTNTHK